MDTVGVANEVIIEHVVVVAAGELPDAAVPDPTEADLLDIDTTGELVVVDHTGTADLATGRGHLTWSYVKC